ncbi:hypothetical protein ACI2IY_07790 [Lysobacter enzymogenes]|uniref:hypothetical protein n=1 Tax=Lysobacter enzymogenes TaxID=69 RepID=UPI00384E10A4
MNRLNLPPLPVPEVLREMLKEYPDHIERLRETLDYFVKTSSPGVDPFDRVVWLLEDRLGTFIVQATANLERAQTSGNEEEISAAKQELLLMSRVSRKNVWIGDETMWEYVQKHGDALL